MSALPLVSSTTRPRWGLTGGEDCGIRDGNEFDDAADSPRSSLLRRGDLTSRAGTCGGELVTRFDSSLESFNEILSS